LQDWLLFAESAFSKYNCRPKETNAALSFSEPGILSGTG
jgi:hypothetical protein